MRSGKGFWRAIGDSVRSWLGGEEYGNSLRNEELPHEGLDHRERRGKESLGIYQKVNESLESEWEII